MSTLGSKADNLIRLRDEFTVYVPTFMTVTFESVITDFPSIVKRANKLIAHYLSDESNESSLQRQLKQLTKAIVPDKQVLEKIHTEATAHGWRKVSFRTSALNEDGTDHSFAGQYESYVDVTYSMKSLKKYVVACFESTLSQRVLSYAKARGLTTFDIGGSVIIQEMFYGKKSGVLFGEDGTRHQLISYNDTWKNTVVEGDSSHAIRIAKDTKLPANTPKELKLLSEVAKRIEKAIEQPVDVEWSYDGTTLAFLQFRPQTTAFRDYVLSWDSTNIAENYPGVTLPLSYSFIRTLYARVYPSFFHMMGTSQKKLNDYAPVFDNMLGYVDGHVYYRISNWYEVVKLIPGRKNQTYFEAMLNPVKKRGDAAKTAFDTRSIIAMVRFLWLLLSSERYSRRFKRLISRKLTEYEASHWQYVNSAVIMQSIKQIRTDLLSAWAIPILNDIRVMVFHGILKTVFFGPKHQEAYLSFLQGLTDRASIRPLLSLTTLGDTVKASLEVEGVATINELRGTSEWPKLEQAAKVYSQEFGARTPDELKLESERITDSTDEILALALKAADDPVTVITKQPFTWPSHTPVLLRPALAYVSHSTRRAVDWRERFRFNRAQVFNVARQAFLAIGTTFVDESIVESPRDIFWLTEQEIDEIVNGHAWNYQPKKLIAKRKREYAQFTNSTVSTGLQGTGMVAPLHISAVEKPNKKRSGLAGSGVAPGLLTAEVIIAKEFDPTLDVRGKILVTGHIDPGWTLLFTQAAGIITERGNALSHAAIIAREIGIPAVVAVPQATTILKTGQVVQMNGVTGEIHETTR